ncbi:MAG: GNAT family N-acetyltransferase [Bacteroidia bacterium]
MRKGGHSDKQLVTKILLSAFLPLEAGNSINFIVKQDSKREQRTKVLMEYLFDEAYDFGEIYISDNEKACVFLKFSEREKLTFRSIYRGIRLALKCIGLSRIHHVLRRQRISHKHFPKEDHIKPLMLATVNDHDGKGSAARLIIELRNLYKNNELPVVIDAASPKNVLMYEKFGFETFSIDKSLGFPFYFLKLNQDKK